MQVAGEPDAATMNRIFQWISRNIKRLVTEHNESKAAATAAAAAEKREQGHVHNHLPDQSNKNSSSKVTVAESELKSLSHYATLDTLVTVVDALNFFDILGSIETLADKNNSAQMLGNTGAFDEAARQQQELVAAVEALNLASPGMGVKKMVAAIKDHHPGLEAVNSRQVHAAVAEINEKKLQQASSGSGGNEAQPIDDRALSQLMLDQIEFANVIIVSKASLFLSQHYPSSERDGDGEMNLGMIKTLLQKLNPKARVIIPRVDKYGDLDVADELLSTGAFDMEEASRSAGWRQELAKEEHVPEVEEYGISSLVFRATDMPFHPARLHSILGGFGSYESVIAAADAASSCARDSDGKGGASSDDHGGAAETTEHSEQPVFQGVIRAKGSFWLANAHAFPISFHSAGKQFAFETSEMPFRVTMCDRSTHHNQVKAGKWRETFGDRQSELVFIGVNLNKELMTERLGAALLTEEESDALGGVTGWRELEDPFFGGSCATKYFDLPAHLQIAEAVSGRFADKICDTLAAATARMAEDEDCDLQKILAEMKSLTLLHNADIVVDLLPVAVPALLNAAPYDVAGVAKDYSKALKKLLKQWGELVKAFLRNTQDQLALLGMVFEWVCDECPQNEGRRQAGGGGGGAGSSTPDKEARLQQVGYIVQFLYEFDVVESEVSAQPSNQAIKQPGNRATKQAGWLCPYI
jgi:G3E family GTPase